jgi:prevent-host-death family protein
MKMTTVVRDATPRRLGVAEAKAHLSEVLRGLAQAPIIIHSRGRDVAVLVDVQTYERLAGSADSGGAGAAFVEAVEAVRNRFGGGVAFDPTPAKLSTRQVFTTRRRA